MPFRRIQRIQRFHCRNIAATVHTNHDVTHTDNLPGKRRRCLQTCMRQCVGHSKVEDIFFPLFSESNIAACLDVKS